MNRILSWKISTGTYAYIYLPNSSSRISSRIPEDSPIWATILNTISRWDKSTYKAEFEKMAAEVEGKYGVKLSWKDEYFSFGDNGATNIVLLAGKDGVDGSNGGSSNNGDSSNGGAWDEVYDEFNKTLDEKLDDVREDIERKNEEVKDFVESEVTQTVLKATQTINDTKKELDNIRKDLEERLGDAAEALNKAAALFEMGEGGIDGEAIKGALSSVKEYGSWLEEYSGCVQSLKTDYDTATNRMGSIGEAEDVKDGLFARFATSLNVISGTVGNVERNMKASEGSIKDMVSWYDAYASAATEVVRFMSASGSVIDDTISHISDPGDNGYTAFLQRQMDAKDAAIKDVIMTETRSGITNITRDMNALSGTINDNIARLSEIDGTLTSMGRKMDASDFTMEQYMTKTDSALTTAIDLRDHWSAESGKISTVASLTAQVDGEGNVMYFVSGSTDSESDDIRVWKGNDGVWRDTNGVTYKEEDVIVHYSNMMRSYIQQQTSAITMSVVGEGNLSAAIKLAISEDSSIISMVAKEVVIDANVIANAISAKTSNIGGILIGDGKIECVKTNNDRPLFLLDGGDGSLYAQNADIEGNIIATSGKIGGFTLSKNRLMVSRNGNYDESVAYLNGSSTYSDSERGTIILAAGISSGRTYHKYTSSQDKEYSTIYTKKKYLISNGDESGCEVEAYEYKEDMRTYVRLENQFYFLTTKVTEQSSEDDIPITDSDGKPAFIKQYVVRKYYKQGEGSNVIEEEYEYNYEGTVSSTEAVANTRIFEDGTIISNTLVANDGYFGGEINAIGKFRGTLENVGGTLKGVTIDANLINGNIVIGNSDSIKAKSDGQLYFNIGKEPLSDNATKEYWNVDAFSWDMQNSNGTNAGQYYTDKTTIAYVPFKSGATITIPALSGSIYRYAADGKTNKTSYLWVEANVRYDGNPIEQILIRETLTAPSHDHKKARTDIIKTSKSGFTAEADGVLSVTFGYDVHLSTYSWLNADKSYAKIKFNTGGSKITVEYPNPTEGVSIASNGMRVLTVSGASVTILDDKITLLSPSKEYGLRITDNGVQIRRKSTSESEWKPL